MRHARRAEEVGFPFALISDHFHPWVDAQGQQPVRLERDRRHRRRAPSGCALGTGVTCPILRLHPAIVAQAAGDQRR